MKKFAVVQASGLPRAGVRSGPDPHVHVRRAGGWQGPGEELELVVSLINRVLDGAGVRTGVHVCRGNWSRDERTLLHGSYHPLAPYLERLGTDQLVLDYATERAGDFSASTGRSWACAS